MTAAETTTTREQILDHAKQGGWAARTDASWTHGGSTYIITRGAERVRILFDPAGEIVSVTFGANRLGPRAFPLIARRGWWGTPADTRTYVAR